MKRILGILLCILLLLVAVFLMGRYGWKLGGFRACESAGIEQVEVAENKVHIRGFYPGSFPQGFLGYHAEQVGDTLYVGFQFSGVFGIFETGDFDIVIPTEGMVTQVVVRSGEDENTIWSKEDNKAVKRKCKKSGAKNWKVRPIFSVEPCFLLENLLYCIEHRSL